MHRYVCIYIYIDICIYIYVYIYIYIYMCVRIWIGLGLLGFRSFGILGLWGFDFHAVSAPTALELSRLGISHAPTSR